MGPTPLLEITFHRACTPLSWIYTTRRSKQSKQYTITYLYHTRPVLCKVTSLLSMVVAELTPPQAARIIQCTIVPAGRSLIHHPTTSSQCCLEEKPHGYHCRDEPRACRDPGPCGTPLWRARGPPPARRGQRSAGPDRQHANGPPAPAEPRPAAHAAGQAGDVQPGQ